MKIPADEIIDTDVLVIGAGGAGASTAIEADNLGADVVMVCKGLFTRDGCSSGAGVFTVVNRHTDPNDTWKVLFEDMLRSGGYMNNQRIAERHSKATVDIALWMEQLGLVFQRQEDGRMIRRHEL